MPTVGNSASSGRMVSTSFQPDGVSAFEVHFDSSEFIAKSVAKFQRLVILPDGNRLVTCNNTMCQNSCKSIPLINFSSRAAILAKKSGL